MKKEDAGSKGKCPKLSDDAWDGIAAVALIAMIVSGVVYWLTNLHA